jgi:SEC-C motif-containing protein
MRQDAAMSTPRPTSCPCGQLGRDKKPLAYDACCGRWHQGPQRGQAPDAEALMRSRYSAYVLGLTDCLLDSWHPSTRPTELEPNEPGLKWLGLDVRSHRQLDADHATVEFVARSKLGGRAFRLHETSRFVRDAETGRWTYVDGDLHSRNA